MHIFHVKLGLDFLLNKGWMELMRLQAAPKQRHRVVRNTANQYLSTVSSDLQPVEWE